jgi:hypothetical protein
MVGSTCTEQPAGGEVNHDKNLVALRQLIERWCDERNLHALRRLLPGYLSLNGLTDGWANLYEALTSTRALGHEAFNSSDWDLLNDLIHWTEGIVYRR